MTSQLYQEIAAFKVTRPLLWPSRVGVLLAGLLWVLILQEGATCCHWIDFDSTKSALILL